MTAQPTVTLLGVYSRPNIDDRYRFRRVKTRLYLDLTLRAHFLLDLLYPPVPAPNPEKYTDQATFDADLAAWRVEDKQRFQKGLALLRPVLPDALRQLGIDPTTKKVWNAHAGCRCSCSPGYVLEHFGDQSLNCWARIDLTVDDQAIMDQVDSKLYQHEVEQYIYRARARERDLAEARKALEVAQQAVDRAEQLVAAPQVVA